ncbi:MAG: hypothetical protein GWN32_00930 [Gemmatimonadetes bacterium]|nr:hypothetical protein [Gemmatimonadota bacterium]
MKDSTLGGYRREHERPPAFQAPDGYSYTVEIMTEELGEGDAGPWSGYLFFLRWEGSEPVGHVETGDLVEAASEADARDALGKLTLREVREMLDRLVAE